MEDSNKTRLLYGLRFEMLPFDPRTGPEPCPVQTRMYLPMAFQVHAASIRGGTVTAIFQR